MNAKMTAAERNAAIEAVKSGRSMNSVSQQYGVTRERIRQIVRKAGVVPALGRDLRADLRAEVPKLVRLGLPDEVVAEELGLSVKAVRRDRRAAGLSERDWRTRFANALREHVEAGGSIRSFCLRENLNQITAGRFAAKLGLRVQHGPHRDLSYREPIIRGCRAEGLTWEQIGARIAEVEGRKLSAMAVYQWAAKHAPDLVATRTAQRRNTRYRRVTRVAGYESARAA